LILVFKGLRDYQFPKVTDKNLLKGIFSIANFNNVVLARAS